ncbi:MAG: hypothetical protein ACI4VN_01970 [Clostridia bacterium]
MKYKGRTLDSKEYFLADIYNESRGIYEYRRKEPQNETSRKNHNGLFLKISKWSNTLHIGELVGCLIAQKIGFKTCDVELFRQHRIRNLYDIGAISYIELAKDDTIITAESQITRHKKLNNMPYPISQTVDIDTIFDAIFRLMQTEHRPYQEYLKFKQDFINMIIFDIKVLNSDRTLENWLIRKNKTTGEIDLYPMFDNSAILGFEENVPPETEGEEEYEKIVKDYNEKEKTIAITTPKKRNTENQAESYREVLMYLLQKYPIETKKAIIQSEKFTVKDLKEILDEIDPGNNEGEAPIEIETSRKQFAIDLYLSREKGIKEIIQEFQIAQKKKTEDQK